MRKILLGLALLVLTSVASATTFKMVNVKTLGDDDFYSSGSKVVSGSFNYVYNFKLENPELVSFAVKTVDNKNYSFGSFASYLYGGSFSNFTFEYFGSDLLNNVTLAPGIYSYSIFGLTDGLKGGKFSTTIETTSIPAVPEPETYAMLLVGLTFIVSRKRFKS